MKRFYLDKKAYHSLENSYKVNISESGHVVAINDTRIRYCIFLDQNLNKWVYSKFLKKRNEFGEFSKEKALLDVKFMRLLIKLINTIVNLESNIIFVFIF